MYSFNQYNGLKGNIIRNGCIDSAMVIIPYKLYKTEKWILNRYNSDGYYIVDCYNKNKNIHIFIDNELCYFNKLQV